MGWWLVFKFNWVFCFSPCFVISQDDSYVDSYISTIGVDFVSTSAMFLALLMCFDVFLKRVKVVGYFVENQNCGAGWKDNQAADCEYR